ncbi:MAG: redoxin domain-containing protein [Duncaniella sp.]|nr:redoxin domain-containing protein [Duncaniella sp.]
MKKTATLFALFALILISVSAHTDRVVRAAEGYKAPAIEITDSAAGTPISFDGKWTLVNFWTSSDPVSRIAAGNYDDLARGIRSNSDFQLLSINVDRSATLYSAIVAADGLSEGTQIHLNPDEATRVAEEYYLERGCNSYLIDPTGKIRAVNPSTETVLAML